MYSIPLTLEAKNYKIYNIVFLNIQTQIMYKDVET